VRALLGDYRTYLASRDSSKVAKPVILSAAMPASLKARLGEATDPS
jgi:hypothetical protein